jgi:hypothetical protein
MPAPLNTIVAISFLATALLSLIRAKTTGAWRDCLVELGTLLLLALLLNRLFGFPLPQAEIAMGPREDILFAAPLFAAMITGMLAQYCYTRFIREQRYRAKWDWGLFVAPIFTSPIIFIPLLAAFLKSQVKSQPEVDLMMLLVAFQNGFFWKEHYENKRRKEAKQP